MNPRASRPSTAATKTRNHETRSVRYSCLRAFVAVTALVTGLNALLVRVRVRRNQNLLRVLCVLCGSLFDFPIHSQALKVDTTSGPLKAGTTLQQAQSETSQQPVFRSGTRLVVETVSVKDKNGKPIEGLTPRISRSRRMVSHRRSASWSFSACSPRRTRRLSPCRPSRRPLPRRMRRRRSRSPRRAIRGTAIAG